MNFSGGQYAFLTLNAGNIIHLAIYFTNQLPEMSFPLTMQTYVYIS